MNSKLKQNNQSGQSTFELMIALFILVISISGIVTVIFGNQFLSVDTEMNNIGIARAQDLLDQQRGTAKNNFAGVVAGVSTDGPYTKTVSVNDISQCQKEVTSQIAWSTQDGAPKQITLTTLISNIAEQIAVGGQCSGQNPPNPALTCPNTASIIGQQTLDTTQAIDTASATGVKAVGNTVYLSATSPNISEKDFWILNVNPSTYAISVDRTNSISTQTGGLNALEIAGSYAYAVSVNGTKQLQIIKFDTSPPTVVASFPLPGNSSAATAIAYRNGKVYVGTDISTGPEFFVINVSNPSSPAVLGSYEIDGKVNKINIVGSLVYLATSNVGKQFIGLDTTNPTAITQISASNPSGSTGGQAVYFLGTKLYTGSFAGSNPNFNILNLATFNSLGSAYLPTLEPTSTGQPANLAATGNMTFVGTGLGTDNKSKLLTINVSNPAAPTLCPGTLKSFTGYSITSMDLKNGLVYLTLNNNLPLRIIRFNY